MLKSLTQQAEEHFIATGNLNFNTRLPRVAVLQLLRELRDGRVFYKTGIDGAGTFVRFEQGVTVVVRPEGK